MKFPLQTDSAIPSVRGWGCLMYTYAWFIALKFDKDFDTQMLDILHDKAVASGIILENDRPTDGSQGLWYRCFMTRPREWLRFVAQSVGHSVFPNELYRAPRIQDPAEYYVWENRAWFKKPCIHFTGTSGEFEYNPDPRIEITGTKTVRAWEIKEV